MKLTLEDYQKAGEEYWPKYDYVAKELGEDAKPEQVLKVMEALAAGAIYFVCPFSAIDCATIKIITPD